MLDPVQLDNLDATLSNSAGPSRPKDASVTSQGCVSRCCADLLFASSGRVFGLPDASEGQLPETPPDFCAEHLCSKFEDVYREKGSVLFSVIACFRKEFFVIFVSGVFMYQIRWYDRVLLGHVMEFFESRNITVAAALWLATAFLAIDAIGQSIVLPWWYSQNKLLAVKIRVALTTAVFKKMIRLGSIGALQVGVGHILALCTSELQRIDTYLPFVATTFVGFSFLCIPIGASTALTPEGGTGLVCGVIMCILSSCVAAPIGPSREKMDAATDTRVRLLSEMLHSIRSVKVCNLESCLAEKVHRERSKEQKFATAVLVWKGISQFSYVLCTPVLMVSMLLGVHVADGSRINAARFYTGFSMVIYIVEMGMYCVPRGVQGVREILLAFTRVAAFLDLDEGPLLRLEQSRPERALSCSKIDFSWNSTKMLVNTSIFANRGEFIAIVGEVGVGKTALMNVLAGQIHGGDQQIFHTLPSVFCPQTPVSFSGTFRSNILFGRPLCEERYQNAIQKCALASDLEGFKDGDLTEIGEQGVVISGGQRQRVSLARALYAGADVFLLDDPFSALDVASKTTIVRSLVDLAKSGKTVILTTHDLHFVQDYAHRTLELKHGGLLVLLSGDAGNVAQTGNVALNAQTDEAPEPECMHESKLFTGEDVVTGVGAWRAYISGTNGKIQFGLVLFLMLGCQGILSAISVLIATALQDGTVSSSFLGTCYILLGCATVLSVQFFFLVEVEPSVFVPRSRPPSLWAYSALASETR